jgi:hypothetical protein
LLAGHAIVAADFDGDEAPGSRGREQERALHPSRSKRRSRNFDRAAVFAGETQPESVAAAEFDDDGDQDLAVANLGPLDFTILRVTARVTSSSLTRAPSRRTQGLSPSIAAATVDGDGRR